MCHAEPFDRLRINSAKHLYHGERDPLVVAPGFDTAEERCLLNHRAPLPQGDSVLSFMGLCAVRLVKISGIRM